MTQALTYVEADIPEFAYRAAGLTSNSYLTRQAALTGLVGGRNFTINAWLRILPFTATASDRAIFNLVDTLGASANLVMRFYINVSTGALVFQSRNAALTADNILWQWASPPQDEYFHVIISINTLNAASTSMFRINGVVNPSGPTTYVSAAVFNYTSADSGIGAYPDGSGPLAGYIGDLWISSQSFDLSVAANLAKFYDTSGAGPVDLGSNGQNPSGSSPSVFMSGNYASGWTTNKGTGGGYTVHGTGSFAAAQIPRKIRFAKDAGYLPLSIDAIPSIKEVKIEPATLSLGEDLGQRATVTTTFKDHKHIWGTESFDSGSAWGKFRGRYGVTLRGYPFRVIQGSVGQILSAMETRHFVLDSTTGPNKAGEFKMIAKDILKLADGDRAQVPPLSQGALSATLAVGGTSFTVTPAGVGGTYAVPGSGLYAIGGKEIVAATRSGDNFTISARGQQGTTAVQHDAAARVQDVWQYSAQSASFILRTLFELGAGIDASFINQTNWDAEIASFLNVVYSAVLAEPTSVNTLASELIEQAGLVVWWDEINEEIRLQVLRPVPTDADTFDTTNIMMDTLEVADQPEKRLSDIYFYFGKLNPLNPQDQENNYASSVLVSNPESFGAYGSSMIKKIFSRWVPVGGRAVAQQAALHILQRYSNPPRKFNFDLLRDSVAQPQLGVGYQLQGWMLQNADGTAASAPIQLTRINPMAERFSIEAEEMLTSTVGGGVAPSSPDNHLVIIDSNQFNVNLRTMHDTIYSTPVSGVTVTCQIYSGVFVGSTSTGVPAFDVGSWPGGVTVVIINAGRIEGKGGNGGQGGNSTPSGASAGSSGGAGGAALFTRQSITLNNSSGQIYGGGGGGGGGGGAIIITLGSTAASGGGGGSGAGFNSGTPGSAGTASAATVNVQGSAGTDNGSNTGGNGGAGGSTSFGPAGTGGNGGGPGSSGISGSNGASSGSNGSGGSGGSSGPAIDGNSFISFSGVGSILGSQIN